MRIESGFGKFNVGEEVTVRLLEIKRTKNKKPYARVLVEGAEQSFNVNIKESDASLHKGRYKIVCTGVNEAGFCYVDFRKVQHSSWDKRDEAMYDVDQLRDSIKDEIRNENTLDIAFSINLTRHYKDRLKYHSSTVNEHIDAILSELYLHYGELVIEEVGFEDVELS